MARKQESNWPALIVVGVIVFAIGRCSADPSPKSDTAPNTLMSSVEPTAAAEEAQAAASEAAAAAKDAAEAAAEPAEEVAEVSYPPEPLEDRSSGGFSCGGKYYCREMDSCEEANFYLNQCGLSRLDGDGDGVPCESIC